MIAGGVESMSRVGMGMSGGAWYMDPSVGFPGYFMPQGVSADLIATKYGFSRDDVDAYAVESQKRAANSWEKGYFKNSVITIKDQNGLTILDRDEHMRPGTDMQALGRLEPVLRDAGRNGWLQCCRHSGAPGNRNRQPCPPCRQFVGHRGWRGEGSRRLQEGWQGASISSARAHSCFCQYRFRNRRLC